MSAAEMCSWLGYVGSAMCAAGLALSWLGFELARLCVQLAGSELAGLARN